MAGGLMAQLVYSHSRLNLNARSCRQFAPNRRASAITTLPLSKNERTLPKDGSGRIVSPGAVDLAEGHRVRRHGGVGQLAIAGKLMAGSSPNGATVSGVM